MSEYLIVLETDEAGGYSGYVPDLPGCVATGDTQDECQKLLTEAITHHIKLLHELGMPIPPATYPR